MTDHNQNILYHANSSEPTPEDPLLVRAISNNTAQDGTKGLEVGGLLFASGGKEGRLGGLAYTMKSAPRYGKEDNLTDHPNGTMAAMWTLGSTIVAIMYDRESFVGNPTTGYLYELPSDSFQQVVNEKTGVLTNEFISTEDVRANNVTKIKGPDIPMQEGVQVFFYTNPDKTAPRLSREFNNRFEERAEQEGTTLETLPEQEKDLLAKEVGLEMLNELTERGELIYENRDRGLDHLNLATGEWVRGKKPDSLLVGTTEAKPALRTPRQETQLTR